MNTKFFKLLLLSLLLFSATGQLPSQDILALLEFKKGIRNDPTGYVVQSWNEESIDFSGCPSSWNGVVCNGGNVAAIVLDNLGLSADVDLSVFANLTMLVKLSMANNSISGRLPYNIGDFRALQFLDISNNLFSSPLPTEIGNLKTLKNLSLACNNFSGSIPDSVSGLKSIQFLDLSHNTFTGFLPSSLTRLSTLVYLNVSFNALSNKIPKGFELLSSLRVLDLRGNMFEGRLHGEFFLSTNASYVDLSGNMLVGASSSALLPGISESVKFLNLSHNKLEGSLVRGNVLLFSSLRVLDLSYNKLSGDLPGFDYAYDLQVLRLSNNRFSGKVPNNLLQGDAAILIELDLSGNALTGSVRTIMSTTLNALYLSSNRLSGQLPLLIGSCSILDLSNNHFDGNLNRLSKWATLEFLDLSQNHLTGMVPGEIYQLLRLNYLNLSGNFLGSSLPSGIAKCPKLRVVDISFNQINGSLSSDVLALPTLQELYLANNSLNGEIQGLQQFNGKFNLLVLDLSHNQLRGYFPDKFGSMNELQVLKLAGNSFNGSLPSSMCGMTSLISLDLSNNDFTGPIPSNLSRNLGKFNVSYNYLSGEVPENLRMFPSSSFFPGNSKLVLPGNHESNSNSARNSHRKRTSALIKVLIALSCFIAVILFILLAIFVHYIRISRRSPQIVGTNKTGVHAPRHHSAPGGADAGGSALVVSAEDLLATRKGSSEIMISPDEKMAPVSGYSPSKQSQGSWSSSSADSSAPESLARLDIRSPDILVGELHFLDDTISITPEELSKAPAEVLGRSSHGTSYRANLENGLFFKVKWLREGVAKPRKEFAKEAKKFANIRHPNVVGLRGYYWGPTQHEKLILTDFIVPGSLANYIHDQGRTNPPLTWTQRLKIIVDVSRGLNYLHFDRAVPHGNLKATNVLLDGPDLNARVADYCLHKLMTQEGITDQVLDAGVLGYCAPELASSKKPIPSFKSDIYAFGVIMLEILTGRRASDTIPREGEPVDLTEMVLSSVADGQASECFDPALLAEAANPAVDKGMKDVLGIALRCIRSVSERPGIRAIYEDLSSI